MRASMRLSISFAVVTTCGALLVGIASADEPSSTSDVGAQRESLGRKAPKTKLPQEAIDAAVQRRFDDALPAYRKRVEDDPDDTDARLDLAGILHQADRQEDALKETREAIRRNPNNAEGHRVLAFQLVKSDQKDAAVAEIREACRLAPQNNEYLHDLAVVLLMAGHGKEGEAELIRCIDRDPNYIKAYTDLTSVYTQQGRLPKAIETASASLAVKETREGRMTRAIACMRNGEMSRAVDDCTNVLQQSPKDHMAYSIRAFANMRLGNFDDALNDAQRTLETGKEYADIAYTVLGGVNLTRGNLGLAEEHLTQAVELGDRPLPHILRALTRFCGDRFDKAAILDDLNCIEAEVSPERLNYRLDGYGWQAYKLRAVTLFRALEPERALGDLTQAIKLNAKDADCYALRGLVYDRTGEWEKSVEDLERALELQPAHDLATYHLIYTLESCPSTKIRDGQRALKLAQAACARTEWRHPEFISQLAAAHSEIGEFENAVLFQEQAIGLLSGSVVSSSSEIKIWWNSRIVFTLSLKKDSAAESLELFKQNKAFHLHPRVIAGSVARTSVEIAKVPGSVDSVPVAK
jgi:tetratricopeptide (TPR) repeat protein